VVEQRLCIERKLAAGPGFDPRPGLYQLIQILFLKTAVLSKVEIKEL
jgi:hypothetical protein